MDLDIPAWVSYALLAFVSVISAANQVNKLLARVTLRWSYAESYLLFIGFFLLPLVLFWALDRVGALHDCSLISALIVALAYPAIISGDSKTSNSAVSAVFSPALKWLNGIPDKLAARLQANKVEFETSVMNAVGRDDRLLIRLENWLLQNTDDLVAVQAKMREWDLDPQAARPNGYPAGSLEIRAWSQGRAQRLAFFIKGTLRVRFLFWQLGLTTARVARREVVRQIIRFALPLGLIALFSFLAATWFRSATPDAQQSVLGDMTIYNVVPRYHAWRYLKANNTASDIHRALMNLAAGLQLELPVCFEPQANGQLSADKLGGEKDKYGAVPCSRDEETDKDPKKSEQQKLKLLEARERRLYSKQISSILQQKDLTMALADDLLKVVFAGRLGRNDLPTACAALRILPPGLRSPNVDIRNRLKRSLNEASTSLWGAGAAKDSLPDDDVGPDAHTVGIEVAVVRWNEYIDSHCAAPTSVKNTPVESTTPPVPDAPIVLSSDVNFDFNSAALREAAAAELETVVTQFQSHEHLKAEIRGYTDSIGAAAYNMKLSRNRALSVKKYLVTQGVHEDDLSAKGFGVNDPIDSNETAEGRARNRRVEIQLQL